MRNVPLLGQKIKRNPTLYVPAGLETRSVVGKCEVPGCGLTFYAGEEEAWQRHVGPCARKNLDAIKAETSKLAIDNEQNWDPEVAAHMRSVGKRMLKEGRMEVLPHERAGF